MSSAASGASTTVTLAFDGAYLSVAPVQQMLSSRGLHASFFANSALVGTDARLSLTQLLSLQADGNEIGGSTAYGLDLFTLDPLEQQREICVDRSWLLASGLKVSSFAYPEGIGDPTTSGAVEFVTQCGYDAARKTGVACAHCPVALPLPPADPLRLATVPQIAVGTSLADLQGYVLDAVAGSGGWLIFVAHQLCDAPSGCDNLSMTTETLTGFLDWLVTEQAQGVAVKTVAEVIAAGPLKPAVAPAPATPPDPDAGLLQNASLEQDTDNDGIPDCWQQGGEGDNLFVFTRVGDAHDGQFAEQIQISQITDGARRLVSKQDLGHCAPAPIVGHRYRVSAWVKFGGLVKLIAYTRDSSGAWSYWDQSPDQSPSSDYQQVHWITPAIPPGALGLSVGVTLESRGSVTLDQIGLEDLGPDSGGGCATASPGTAGGWPSLLGLLLFLRLRRRGPGSRVGSRPVPHYST